MVDTLAGYVVKAVEVVAVGGYHHCAVLLLDGNDRLEDDALAVLNPLSHGVEVGGVVDSRGEYAFVVLALTFAVELFPPFAEEVEFGMVIYEYLDFLAVAIEGVAGLGIELCGRSGVGACRLHVGRAGEERTYVEASHGDGQKAHGREHGEASADVVVDDECVVAFVGGQRAEGTA